MFGPKTGPLKGFYLQRLETGKYTFRSWGQSETFWFRISHQRRNSWSFSVWNTIIYGPLKTVTVEVGVESLKIMWYVVSWSNCLLNSEWRTALYVRFSRIVAIIDFWFATIFWQKLSKRWQKANQFASTDKP